jgi:hypothetical protein
MLAKRLAEQKAYARERDLGLEAGLGGLLLTEGAYLLGPRLGLSFSDHFPLRMRAGVGWMSGALPMHGDAPSDSDAPSWSEYHLDLAAEWAITIRRRSLILPGAALSISAVHVGGEVEVDDISGQRDTWSARAGGHLAASHTFSDLVSVRCDLDAGTYLRRIPLRYGDEQMSLGGAFVGLSLGVFLSPVGRRP